MCVLDTKHIVGEAVVKPVREVENWERKQFYDYVEKGLSRKQSVVHE